MAGAAADRLGELFQRRCFLALFDQAACPRDDCRIGAVQLDAVRLAALAWAEARGPRGFQRVMKLDVLRIGGSRCA
jgi:hypothetical protein